MNSISIDFSEHCTGIYTSIEGKGASLSIKNKARISREEALKNIYISFKAILTNTAFDFGFIEGYGFNKQFTKSMICMCEVAGVIKCIFALHNIPLIEIPIQTWKRLTIGKEINKRDFPNEYLQAIKFRYEKEFSNTDEADAFLIYQAARIIGGTTKYMTPVVKKIKTKISKAIDSKRKGLKDK